MTDPIDTEALLERAKEARALADGATPGPWTYCRANQDEGCPCGLVWATPLDRIVLTAGGDPDLSCDHDNAVANGRFAANARNDVPLLANAIEALAKENAALRDENTVLSRRLERALDELIYIKSL